jgi:hypothetical protein
VSGQVPGHALLRGAARSTMCVVKERTRCARVILHLAAASHFADFFTHLGTLEWAPDVRQAVKFDHRERRRSKTDEMMLKMNASVRQRRISFLFFDVHVYRYKWRGDQQETLRRCCVECV